LGGFEPPTSSLPRTRSTPELQEHLPSGPSSDFSWDLPIQSLNLLAMERLVWSSNLWKAGGKLPESGLLSKKISPILIFFTDAGNFG
jgi:hypothetical protein